MRRPRNIVDPQIRAVQKRLGLSQPMLAARCQVHGWNLSRETLAKIESQIRWVADFELLCLSKCLKVPIVELLPDRANMVPFSATARAVLCRKTGPRTPLANPALWR
jgi:hypothetical protein